MKNLLLPFFLLCVSAQAQNVDPFDMETLEQTEDALDAEWLSSIPETNGIFAALTLVVSGYFGDMALASHADIKLANELLGIANANGSKFLSTTMGDIFLLAAAPLAGMVAASDIMDEDEVQEIEA